MNRSSTAENFDQKYESFLDKYVVNGSKGLIFTLIFLSGVVLFMDFMLDEHFMKDPYVELHSWRKFWLVAIPCGAVYGLLYYYVFGTVVYHVLTLFAGGQKGGAEISRRLCLFVNLPICLNILIWLLIGTFGYGDDYFTQKLGVLTTTEIVLLVLFVPFYVSSLYLSYKGVLTLRKTTPGKTFIFFVILPVMVYSLQAVRTYFAMFF